MLIIRRLLLVRQLVPSRGGHSIALSPALIGV